MHYLEPGVEVGIPDVEGYEERAGDAAGAHYGGVEEEVEGNEGFGGEELFVEGEEDEG